MTHICVSKLTIIDSDNGLSPVRHQAIIWTNAGILLIQTLGTNFSAILIEIHTFSFKKMHLKLSSAKWQQFCLSLNVSIGSWGTNFNFHQNSKIFFKKMHWKMPSGKLQPFCLSLNVLVIAEMCSERDSPLERLYRLTHAKLTRLASSGQLVWAPGCELSLALVHARWPAWPGETSAC